MAALIVAGMTVLGSIEPDDADNLVDDETQPLTVGTLLAGQTIESLVHFEVLSIRLESDALAGSPADSVDITVGINAALTHSFDGPVRELEFGVAVLPRGELDFAWSRLHTPPLRLTTADVDRKLVPPIALLTVPGDDLPLAPGALHEVNLRESFEDVAVGRGGSPAYLAALSGYTLDSPTERDVLRILEHGGPADLSALANWTVVTAQDGSASLDDAAKDRIMTVVEAQLRRLRAPPAFGDFQRLNALTGVALVCALPQHLERLLALQRPITILLSAAQVSYDAAANEESLLGVSVHGFRGLQSRSDSAVSWESGLRRLRLSSLDRLVRLAFEPLDFRDSPAQLHHRSALHVQAAQLLLPLTTTQTERVLGAVSDRPETQRELLRFYVEVRHAAAVEPLVDWLLANPRYLDELGSTAIDSFGDRMLPVLMRRFDDVDAEMTERMAICRILALLPEKHARQLDELARSMGIEVANRAPGRTPDVSELLQAIRDHDVRLQHDRVDELLLAVVAPAHGAAELRSQLRAGQRLGLSAPSRVLEVADAIIGLHVAAARAFDADFPNERVAALRALQDFSLGPRHDDAMRAAALVEAELGAARGEVDAALGVLEAFDPQLASEEVRVLYLGIAEQHWDTQVALGAWPELEQLLDRAEVTVPEAFDVAARRIELEQRKRAPLLIVGGIVGTALFGILLFALQTAGVPGRLRRRLRARAARVAPSDLAASDADLGDRDGAPDEDGGEFGELEQDPDHTDDVGSLDPVGRPILDDSWSGTDDRASPLDDFAA